MLATDGSYPISHSPVTFMGKTCIYSLAGPAPATSVYVGNILGIKSESRQGRVAGSFIFFY